MNPLNLPFQNQFVQPSISYPSPHTSSLLSLFPSLMAAQKLPQQPTMLDSSVLVKRPLPNTLLIPSMEAQKKVKMPSPELVLNSTKPPESFKSSIFNMRDQALQDIAQKMAVQQSLLVQAQQAALAANLMKLSAPNPVILQNNQNSQLINAFNSQNLINSLAPQVQNQVITNIPKTDAANNERATTNPEKSEKPKKLNKPKAKEESKKKPKPEPIEYYDDDLSDSDSEPQIEDEAYVPNNRRIKKSIEMTPKRVLRQRKIREVVQDNTEAELKILEETITLLQPLLGYQDVNREKVFKLLKKVDMSPKKLVIKVKRNRTYYIKYFEMTPSDPVNEIQNENEQN